MICTFPYCPCTGMNNIARAFYTGVTILLRHYTHWYTESNSIDYIYRSHVFLIIDQYGKSNPFESRKIAWK